MSILVYTRPGYESTAAQELSQIIANQGWNLYPLPWKDLGFCEFRPASANADREYHFLSPPIFARQWLSPARRLEELPETDRISPLLDVLEEWLPKRRLAGFHIEHPDTNEGGSLARFCKKFAGAFNQALTKRGFERGKAPEAPFVHICFDSYRTCFIGLRSHSDSPWASGIPRLKMPAQAPSRSTLKLEEAFLRLLTQDEQNSLFKNSEPLAVDLGAAPGGWTYQLVQRGFFVTAVDNGPMQAELMATGSVEHLRQDAFHFQPPSPVHLMVCDMVEQPSKVCSLVERWLSRGWCGASIFNFKLPMKKKAMEVNTLLDRLRALRPISLRASHLYHDRDEITVYVKIKS